MALAQDDLYRLTVEDYLVLAGISDLGRTELIEGVIYNVTPESMGHTNAVEDIYLRLVAVIGRRAHMAGSIRVSDNSMCDPDVWVERRYVVGDVDYVSAADVNLAIEITRTSLSRDLGPKLRGYASAGIPGYWVVSPDPGGFVLLHSEPVDDTYLQVQRIELPNGYRDLPVEVLWQQIAQ